jgi:hypothetical protein
MRDTRPQHALGQVPVVLLRYLRPVGRSLEHRRIVVHVLDVDHHRRVVLFEVIGRGKPQLVLAKRKDFSGILEKSGTFSPACRIDRRTAAHVVNDVS